MLNRRRFVCGLVSLGVLGPTLSDGPSAAPRTRLPSLRGRLSKDVFVGLQQQRFTAVIDGRRVPLVLTKVIDDGSVPDREQFTVLFQGPLDPGLTDGDCLLTHPTAGATRLYVQVARLDDRSSSYRAPFNLLS